jgi:hypothetical protein
MWAQPLHGMLRPLCTRPERTPDDADAETPHRGRCHPVAAGPGRCRPGRGRHAQGHAGRRAGLRRHHHAGPGRGLRDLGRRDHGQCLRPSAALRRGRPEPADRRPGQGLDGQRRRPDLQLRAQARPEVRQRQRGDGRGRGLVAAARGAAGQDTGLHPDAVRLHQGQRQGPHQDHRRVDADADHREGLRADLRLELPDGQRGRGGRQEAGAEQGGRGRPGLRLAEDQLRRVRPAEDPRVARQRGGGAGAQRRLLGGRSRPWRA